MGRGQGDTPEHAGLASEPRDEFLRLGEICNGRLINEQTQYVSYYLGGFGKSPDLSKDIRFTGERGDYHSMTIHAQDAEEFAKRVNHYRSLIYNANFDEAQAYVASL